MMGGFYVGGGGGFYAHAWNENAWELSSKMVPNMATLFLFFIEGNRRTRRKTLFFLFYSFCHFFLSLLKKTRKKRIRNKKENRKEENRKKEKRKRIPFFYRQQVSFFCFFSALPFCFSTIRHRHFFVLIQAPPFCVCDNLTRLVSYFRQSDTAIFLS